MPSLGRLLQIEGVQNVSPGAPGWVKSVFFAVSGAMLFQEPVQAASLVQLDTIQRDGYGIVQLKHPVSNEFFMEASLNGHPIRLILDTGALSHNITLSNGCEKFMRIAPHPIKGTSFAVSGKAMGKFTEGVADSFALGNIQTSGTTIDFVSFTFLHNRSVEGVWTTTSVINNARANLDADGFLGMGFLQKCAAIIDLPNARLYLKPPGSGRTLQLEPALKSVGYLTANFNLTNSAVIVDVSINGIAGKMIVDTGSYLTVLDSRFAARAKLHTYRSGLRWKDAAGVDLEPDMADPTSFKVAGVEVLRTKMVVESTGFYSSSGGKVIGLLGMDLLGQSWGIIDFAQHKLYFSAVK